MLKFLIVLFFILSAAGTTYASTEIEINLPEYKLQLVRDGILIKSYDIAIGSVEDQTPVGNYEINEKEADPTWYPTEKQKRRGDKITAPGADNPLGIRWIGFNGVYGIHGTNQEDKDKIGFGYAVSTGCIRMHNSDVSDLYNQVEVGTPVKIVYQNVVFTKREDGLYVRLLPDVYQQNTNTLENYKIAFQNYFNKYLNEVELPNIINQDIKLVNLKP